jgi:hypothetical protein
MTHPSKTMILGITALGAFVGGCATTIETGPGYYHYDTRAAGSPPAIVHEAPAVVVQQPAVVDTNPPVLYSNPPVVYTNPPVVYSNPPVVSTDSGLMYRYPKPSAPYTDHGQ